jgi:hypothetical protein
MVPTGALTTQKDGADRRTNNAKRWCRPAHQQRKKMVPTGAPTTQKDGADRRTNNAHI